MTTTTELQQKVGKLETNMDRFDDIVNGADNLEVTVDSGTVPSVAKFFATAEDRVDALIAELQARGETLPPDTLVVCLNIGQSLDRERNLGGRITDTPPAKGLAPNGGYETGQQSDWVNNSIVQHPDNFDTYIPFAQRDGYEGWGGGSIIQHAKPEHVRGVVFYANGIGGTDWEFTGPGSGPYGTGLVALEQAYKHAVANNWRVRVHIRRSQGEADADTLAAGGGSSEARVTKLQWEAVIDEMVEAWSDHWRIISNGSQSPPTFVEAPLNSGGHYAEGGRAVQAAQLAKAQEGKITLLPARYQFYSDTSNEWWQPDLVHPSTKHYRLYAELAALIEKRLVAGEAFLPLHVTSGSRSGAVITLNLSKDAEVDTTDVTEPTLYPNGKRGIHVFQSDGTTEVLVNSAVLTDARTITVTCDTDPGAGALVRIAQQDYPGGNQAMGRLERANFRATETLGTSDYLDGGTARTFYDYIINQEVAV